MQVNAREFLTSKQKEDLGKAYFQKMMEGIKAIKFNKGKGVDITGIIQSDIEEIFESADVYSQMDVEKIGKALTDKIIEAVERK